VQRQYSGTAGRIENCQLGVFLAYDSPRGRVLIDRELYLPESWIADRTRCREAGVPEAVGFATKPELARRMLERALDAGVPAAWVTGDEVYGNDPALRGWLEQRGVSHVLVVKRSEPLVAAGAYGPVRSTAEELAATVAGERWLRCNAGFGAKGPRWYDWTQVPLVGSGASGRARWLLVRRSIDDPSELAFYVCWGPAATALIGLVRVAGARSAVEEGFEQTKGGVGLDHYEVRRYDGWYRQITLALLAYAFLAVTRATAAAGGAVGGQAKGGAAGSELARISCR
jgi:SRSO17 transposase